MTETVSDDHPRSTEMVEKLRAMMIAAAAAHTVKIRLPLDAPAEWGWPRASVGQRIGEPW